MSAALLQPPGLPAAPLASRCRCLGDMLKRHSHVCAPHSPSCSPLPRGVAASPARRPWRAPTKGPSLRPPPTAQAPLARAARAARAPRRRAHPAGTALRATPAEQPPTPSPAASPSAPEPRRGAVRGRRPSRAGTPRRRRRPAPGPRFSGRGAARGRRRAAGSVAPALLALPPSSAPSAHLLIRDGRGEARAGGPSAPGAYRIPQGAIHTPLFPPQTSVLFLRPARPSARLACGARAAACVGAAPLGCLSEMSTVTVNRCCCSYTAVPCMWWRPPSAVVKNTCKLPWLQEVVKGWSQTQCRAVRGDAVEAQRGAGVEVHRCILEKCQHYFHNHSPFAITQVCHIRWEQRPVFL